MAKAKAKAKTDAPFSYKLAGKLAIVSGTDATGITHKAELYVAAWVQALELKKLKDEEAQLVLKGKAADEAILDFFAPVTEKLNDIFAEPDVEGDPLTGKVVIEEAVEGCSGRPSTEEFAVDLTVDDSYLLEAIELQLFDRLEWVGDRLRLLDL